MLRNMLKVVQFMFVADNNCIQINKFYFENYKTKHHMHKDVHIILYFFRYGTIH